MTCQYCGSHLSDVPDNGICPNCGGALPARKAARQPQIIYQVQAPTYQDPPVMGVNCCSRCMSRNIRFQKRGFSWGRGLLWFFLLPGFGILLGFVGSKKLVYRCHACGHKWTR